jgi:hypothetical protein
MDDSIRKLWAKTRVRLWPETYWLVSLPHESLPQAVELVSRSAGRFSAIVTEQDEISLTVHEALWKAKAESIVHHSAGGPYRVITFQIDLDLSICGYFAPAAVLLAEAGIPIVPQCAFLKDHVLIREADAARAVEILNELVESCAGH